MFQVQITHTESKHCPDLLVSQHHLPLLLRPPARGLHDHRQVALQRPGDPHHLRSWDPGLGDLLLQAGLIIIIKLYTKKAFRRKLVTSSLTKLRTAGLQTLCQMQTSQWMCSSRQTTRQCSAKPALKVLREVNGNIFVFICPILKEKMSRNHISRLYRFLWFATHIINQWSNASFVWFSVKTNWNPCFWRWNIFQSSVNLSKKIHHLLFCRLHFLLSYRHNWTVNFPLQ